MELFYWLICALLCPPSTLTHSPWPLSAPADLGTSGSSSWSWAPGLPRPTCCIHSEDGFKKRTTSYRCMLSPNNSCLAQSWPLDYIEQSSPRPPFQCLPVPSALLPGMVLVLLFSPKFYQWKVLISLILEYVCPGSARRSTVQRKWEYR